jgi:hypothetical protein
VTDGKTEVTERQGRKCKQLLHELRDKRRYWNCEEGAVDHTVENPIWKRLRT